MQSEYSSYIGEMDINCNPKTPPHSPVNDENSVDCLPWNSRSRRLFPQRRTSIPASINCGIDAKSCFPTFEHLPSDDVSTNDRQEFDSSASSPSSAGSGATVNVRKSPASGRPFSETDFSFREDGCVRTPCMPGVLSVPCSVGPQITLHKSPNMNLSSDFSARLYTDAPARAHLQWKSMAQFHKARHCMSPGILSPLPNDEQAPCDSGNHHDPLVAKNDDFKGSPLLETGPCQWSQWRQSLQPTAHPNLSPVGVHQDSDRDKNTYVVAKGDSSLDVPALRMATCDCTVKMSTVATVTGDGKLHVHHLALLSVIMPMEAPYSGKVGLSFMVSNALRTDHKCSLELGQSSLLFKEDICQSDVFPRKGAELIIVRDSCDLEKPVNLYFAFTYSDPYQSVMASLPTLWPKKGNLLSEVVLIAEPQPPLRLEAYTRDPLNSWRLYHHPVNQVTCYERIGLPRRYHAGVQDDIEIRFAELDPVRFRALGDSPLSRVVWKLDITVYELTGGRTECRMSFFVDVGLATALVSLIPNGWVPHYFIIEGCVATEKAGECWKNKGGYITVFKQAHMGPGPVMVETYWQGPPPKDISHDIGSACSLSLPGLADRKVLGGRLTCLGYESKSLWPPIPMMSVNGSIVILLNHLRERIRPYGPVDETYTLLPTMDTGYSILLKRVATSRAQRLCRSVVVRRPSLPAPEDTQLSEHSVKSPDAKMKKAKKIHRTSLSHNANNVRKTALTPKHLLQLLFLSLLILMFLVPCFLLFVEHIRKDSNYNERTSWRDRDRDTSTWDGERLQANIDAAGSESLQPAIVAENKAGEMGKCEGWRDWVDYGSGWKGCIP